MPSKSKKQARTMAAAAHNASFAKKVGIPQSVARDFNKADARRSKSARAKLPGHALTKHMAASRSRRGAR